LAQALALDLAHRVRPAVGTTLKPTRAPVDDRRMTDDDFDYIEPVEFPEDYDLNNLEGRFVAWGDRFAMIVSGRAGDRELTVTLAPDGSAEYNEYIVHVEDLAALYPERGTSPGW
jgi:hypothetical protein